MGFKLSLILLTLLTVIFFFFAIMEQGIGNLTDGRMLLCYILHGKQVTRQEIVTLSFS